MKLPDDYMSRQIGQLKSALAETSYSYEHIGAGTFVVEGHRYDLSAADPGQIERIVSEGLMRL